MSALAIHGGTPVRSTPMPPRFAMGLSECEAWRDCLKYYYGKGLDPGYQGPYEQRYTDAFCKFMGEPFGEADAVNSGTSALTIAVRALNLPQGSQVLVSPITDPGTITAIVENGLVPKLCDTMPGSYNTGPDEVAARLSPRVSAVMVVHAAGEPAPVDRIVDLVAPLPVIEDCSQAHGAQIGSQKVGTFGRIAAFSTMYRKAHITGETGGIVYCRDLDLYHCALAHADRGKNRWEEGFTDRDPSTYLFPAGNYHQGETNCAIGIASLARLPQTIERRLEYVNAVNVALIENCDFCKPAWSVSRGLTFDGCSPFYFPIRVIDLPKMEFALALRAEGIDLNPHYRFVVSEWPWAQPYLADDFVPVNAISVRDRSLVLYLNECYGEAEVRDTIEAVLKVERALVR